jgi:predicted nucleic acid-binding protein
VDPTLTDLDPGEREAIILAEVLHADALVIDDRAGRREMERRPLRVIGTLRVLVDGAEAGLLDLPNALGAVELAGFYLDRGLFHIPPAGAFMAPNSGWRALGLPESNT